MGLVDLLEEAGIPAFGPSYQAAQLEVSKAFSKKIMRDYSIPTAEFERFDIFDDAVSYARSLASDMWIKASGLAAGKGAVYAADPVEAESILRGMMVDDCFGESGREVVIEENMQGEEASIFALSDGATYRLLVSSQDHKRALDGDKGLNTGGMGAYAPAPVVTPGLLAQIEERVLQPTIDAMASEGAPYRGMLYAGIMITADGPKVVEFNCRFGDPETQAVLPLLDGDLAEILMACAKGDLSRTRVGVSKGSALCVVMASGGYPGSYDKGFPIGGIEEAERDGRVKVFHAGTAFRDEEVVTSGGRVLGVTGWGDDFGEARKHAYDAAAVIAFEGAFYRGDIGYRAMKRISDN